MGALQSPGVRVVVPGNRWANFGGSLEGDLGLQERFGKSHPDFNQPPHEGKGGCVGYISGYLMALIGTTGLQGIGSTNLRNRQLRHGRRGGITGEIWPATKCALPTSRSCLNSNITLLQMELESCSWSHFLANCFLFPKYIKFANF